MQGKFDPKYFFKGAGLEDWFKSWGLGWRLIITLIAVLFVIVTIWRAYFMKTQTQKQTNSVIALPFSRIEFKPEQEQKQEIKKRPWWLPVLFIEGYGFSEPGRTGIGSRAGARFEF